MTLAATLLGGAIYIVILPDVTISYYNGSMPASGGLTVGGGMIVS